MSSVPATDLHAAEAYVLQQSAALGRRFVDADLDKWLRLAATALLPTLAGADASDFVVSVARGHADGRPLSVAQARGILNVVVSEAERRIRREAAESERERNGKAHAAPPVEEIPDGFFTFILDGKSPQETDDWVTIRVLTPRNKEKAYKKLGFLRGQDNGADYTYIASLRGHAWSLFRTTWRNGEEIEVRPDAYAREQRAFDMLVCTDENGRLALGQTFALLSNSCRRCGRLLTRPDSLDRSMGADCASKYGLGA